LNKRYDRRLFLARSTRVVGGLTIVSTLPAVLWGCGDDDDSTAGTSAGTAAGTTAGTAAGTTTAGTAAGTTTAGTAPATTAGTTATTTVATVGGEPGTVGTQFNWVPDIEWASWYLAEENGHFAKYNVTSELGHGGPNTPAVVQLLAAGDGNVGISSGELDITRANAEGSDFVIIGAMYQRNPLGLTWLKGTKINSAADLVGKRIGGPQGDDVTFNAVLKVNNLPLDYTYVPMSFDPQPLVDGEMDVIISYVTNQPIQLRLQGHEVEAKPYSDFGLPSYGDILFASKAWIADNRDLLVRYLAGLLLGVDDNRADPTAAIPILVDKYGSDTEINTEYATAANPEYIALMDSDFTDKNGLLSVDPVKMKNEVLPGLKAAGATDLPTVDQLLDVTILQDAHELG
jgi:ABC-type nitrate/sulfonate/bicarbonate transport system substrate-binding protein